MYKYQRGERVIWKNKIGTISYARTNGKKIEAYSIMLNELLHRLTYSGTIVNPEDIKPHPENGIAVTGFYSSKEVQIWCENFEVAMLEFQDLKKEKDCLGAMIINKDNDKTIKQFKRGV